MRARPGHLRLRCASHPSKATCRPHRRCRRPPTSDRTAAHPRTNRWPDGQYTAPTDEALAYDIAAVPMFGLNMIRLHQKVNPERCAALSSG